MKNREDWDAKIYSVQKFTQNIIKKIGLKHIQYLSIQKYRQDYILFGETVVTDKLTYKIL